MLMVTYTTGSGKMIKHMDKVFTVILTVPSIPVNGKKISNTDKE